MPMVIKIFIKTSVNEDKLTIELLDIQVLQDFLTLINASGATEPNKQWKFTKKTIESMDELANLFYSQVNSGMSDQKYQTLEKFYSTNSESLAEYFNTMFSI